MFLVTGGAGFIGSNVVARLNEAGHGDVAVCDYLAEGKWRNLQKRRLADFVAPADLTGWPAGCRLDAVFHMGAISETAATDGDLVIATNFRLPLELFDWCAATHTPVAMRNSYQYFAEASVDHLRQAGYSGPFTPIDAAVKTYVTHYLDCPDRCR